MSNVGGAVPLGNMGVKLTLDSLEYEAMFERAVDTITKAGKKLESMGKSLSTYVTAPIVALAGVSVKTFADFDEAMTKSTSIMGNVSDEMRTRLEENARGISTTTATSADKLAEAYYFLASAGLNAEQSVASLGTVEKFATAGQFDLSRATEMLADAQSALGLSSKDASVEMQNMTRVSDVLVQAGNLSNASTEQFAKALTTKAAAGMRMLNKDMEEGVAVLMAFADQGIKGENAGEGLSVVLRDLQIAAVNNAQEWTAFGISVYDASGKMLPLVTIVQELERTFGPMSDEQKKVAAGMLGFQERSFSAIQALMGTSGKIMDYEAALRSAGGTTKDVADKQMKSFSNQMKILYNNVMDVAYEIGAILAPHLLEMGEYVKQGIEWWRGLSAEEKQQVVSIQNIRDVLEPLTNWLGKTWRSVESVVRQMVSWVGVAVAVAAALGPLFLSLSGVIGVATTLYSVVKTILGLFVGWTGVIGLVVLSLAIVTDAILQMTGKGNLGLIDMVESFRVGGHKISTWMTAAWLVVFDNFDWMVMKINEGWDSVKWATKEVAGYLWRAMLTVWREIAEAALWALDKMTLGQAGFDKTIEESNDFFNEKIESSLSSASLSYERYYKDLGKMEKAHKDQSKVYQDAIDETFSQDMSKPIQKQIDYDVDDLRTAEAEISGLLSTGGQVDLSHVVRGNGVASPYVMPQMPKGPGEGVKVAKEQEFQTISLRRFALDSSGSYRSEGQDVRAKGVEKRLDKLIEVTEKKPTAMVLQ